MLFFLRSRDKRALSQDPVLNLPPEDSDTWNVTRNYDNIPVLSPETSTQTSSEPSPRKITRKKNRSNTLKADAALYQEEKLSSLRFEGLAAESPNKTTPHKSPKLPKDRAERLLNEGGLSEPQHNKSTRQDSVQAVNGMNGGAGAMNGASNLPIHAGQQMDLNFIYSKVLELSEQLRTNREQTHGLIAGAEELANRAASSSSSPEVHKAESQISTARIADLTHKLAEAESVNKVLLREQRENGKLIGEYEQAVEKVVGMLRDYAYHKESEKGKLAKQYLSTLQAERDEHLKTRLERDTANAHILKLMAQMRQAYHLSVEESRPELEIVSGLQNEVRSLRNALGLPKERFEDETGYSVLQHIPGGMGEEDD